MLIGEYKHSLDQKSRVSLPSKFRGELGRRVVLTRGLDNCLFLYPVKEWQRISSRLAERGFGQADTRGFNRFLFSGAADIRVDSIGRILIPDFLKEFAGLSSEVVFAGVHNRVELWNEQAWDAYKQRIEKQGEVLAEKLGDIGAL
jgi:MraZ protein